MTGLKKFAWAACSMVAVVLSQGSLQAQTADAAGEVMWPQEAVAATEAGLKLLAEKNWREALAKFNEAIAIEGAYPVAWFGKGEALREMEDYQSAANAYSQAIDRDPSAAAAYNGRGECFLELQQIDLAANDFNNALERSPSDPKVLSNIGHIMVNYSRGDAAAVSTAIRRLDDAIAGDPQDARAYRDRGFAKAMLREFDKAEIDLNKAAEIDPADYENFAVLANVYLFQDNYEKSIGALSKAIDAYKPEKRGDPEIFVTGYTLRADARLRLAEKEKDAAKAEELLKAVVADADLIVDKFEGRQPEEGRAYFRKGRALRMLKQYSDAVNAFTRAISEVQSSDAEYMADALMYRGICWYYMGEPDLARGDFEQASATGSGYQDPRVFLWIGFTHHQQGNHRDAINSYGEALAKAPNFALAHVNKGRAYMDLKEYRRAIESFNDAIRAEPEVGENYYNVGFAYMQLEEYKKAADFFRLALLQDNPQPKMFQKMAEALRELGKNDLAEEYERKAAEANTQAAGN